MTLTQWQTEILRWALVGDVSGHVTRTNNHHWEGRDPLKTVEREQVRATVKSDPVKKTMWSPLTPQQRHDAGAVIIMSDEGPVPIFAVALDGVCDVVQEGQTVWDGVVTGTNAVAKSVGQASDQVADLVTLSIGGQLVAPGPPPKSYSEWARYSILVHADSIGETTTTFSGADNSDVEEGTIQVSIRLEDYPLPQSTLRISDKIASSNNPGDPWWADASISAKIRHQGTSSTEWDLRCNLLGSFLLFDGVELSLVDAQAEAVIASWPAFSGRPTSTASREGLESKENGQRAKDVGPTPEGLYAIATSGTRTQAQAESAWDWIKWNAKASSWGLAYTPLVPLADTDTFGRDRMFVHGGATPGSAGCIDLVDGNMDFHHFLDGTDPAVPGLPDDFEQWTGRLLVVDYLPVRQTMPRTHDTPLRCPQSPGGPQGYRMACTEAPECDVNRAYLERASGERSVLISDLCQRLKGQ